MRVFRLFLLSTLSLAAPAAAALDGGALSGQRPRVLVSTDIGGSDPDDFQSMVHLLLYADVLDLEGLVSSPWGPGRRSHILEVIDRYAADHANLKTHSSRYPTPDELRAITKQGAFDPALGEGVSRSTEGSDWIVRCARRGDPRPLWVLVWGTLDDLAQALHDDPGIAPKLRVYSIAGPNKKWGIAAYEYLLRHHPDLWMIESNDTYRGWFTGGDQQGDLGNESFVSRHAKGAGALGEYFAGLLRGRVKMGDTPSVAYLLRGTPEDPTQPSWGGRHVRAWARQRLVVRERAASAADEIEQFGILEIVSAPLAERQGAAALVIDGQRFPATIDEAGGVARLRFMPKEAKRWTYRIESTFAALDGQGGEFTSLRPPAQRAAEPDPRLPRWWTDDPSPEWGEGEVLGARSVSQWRADFLRDFALRLRRCRAPAKAKPRVVVLTDIENEPDDAQSMVRFLTYSNQWDVEALVATTSVHQKDKTAPWRIREIVEAYRQVEHNLSKHEPGYPDADSLLSVIREGRPAYGMAAVGLGMDSPGSEAIIHAVDRDDPRPVWVLVWGGPNCLAQALFKVRATRSPEDLERFVSRLRVYTISDQDDSGPWIRKTFPNLFYIASPGFGAGGAYHYATWSGISGDRFHGRFAGADFSMVDNPWLDRNVRARGPLGAQHPFTKFLMEGDTPSFLYLVDNGLGDPEHPDWGSWGGRYELYTPRTRKWFLEPETRPFWSDAEDEVLGADGNWYTSNKATIWRWRSAYQNDFAARMDWTIRPYAEANHPPSPKLGHASRLSAKVGARVDLSAEGSTDPDGDALSYEWFHYGEPGTLTLASGRTAAPLKIEGANEARAFFTAPKATKPETLHVVLAVTDGGKPPLTRYQRVIVTVFP